jgi:rhodanese-related sulfurtransferase
MGEKHMRNLRLLACAILAAAGLAAPAAAKSPSRELIALVCKPGTDTQKPGAAYAGGLSKAFSALTPLQLPGATTVSSDEAECILNAFGEQVLVLSGMNDGNAWMPMARDFRWAAAGEDTPALTTRFETEMTKLTGGDKDRPLIVYCHHESCFLSYNVAWRAVKAGYKSVYWLRPGILDWDDYSGRQVAEAPGEALEARRGDDYSLPAEPDVIDSKCFSYPYREVQTSLFPAYPRDSAARAIKSQPLILVNHANAEIDAAATTGIAMRKPPTVKLDLRSVRQSNTWDMKSKRFVMLPGWNDAYLGGFDIRFETLASRIERNTATIDVMLNGSKLFTVPSHRVSESGYDVDDKSYSAYVDGLSMIMDETEDFLPRAAKWAKGGVLRAVLRAKGVEVASAEFPAALHQASAGPIATSWRNILRAYGSGRCVAKPSEY